MRIELEFKVENEARLSKEFRIDTNGITQAITLGLAYWLYMNYGIVLTVTCICRTQEENEKVGGKPTSRHLERPCPAMDYRTRDWPSEAVPDAIDFLIRTWGDLIYVLKEKDHLHIQLGRKFFADGKFKIPVA